ncbi:TAXI family TRAP transporter solute-binding subunit [Dethiobacter alkaliphilus]|uniref:TAXI family TRAP transporter solute-binding subunit n=1 Tax=Dethiobacter alkaliphilus TaxID=427926 RepID=UPI002227B939|nr:TAXI family TRAP transporter solute-binding subunit [Dethiobacter alkaliphilus]MCW3489557.1 TAXI family TRAP transporter solute-binding subunit [Dethiobacter alkaliphilus]
MLVFAVALVGCGDNNNNDNDNNNTGEPSADYPTSLRDLEGMRVGAGPAGGTIGTFAQRFFDLLEINATMEYGGIGDLVEMQADGLIDANGFAAGIPVSAFREYEVTQGADNVVFIGIDGADRDAILAEWPYFAPASIPADTYDALDADLETVGVWNIAIAHKTLSDDMVYDMVKAVMENNEDMMDAHAAAAETVPENFEFMDVIPLHPGAARYFEEIGYDIPAELVVDDSDVEYVEPSTLVVGTASVGGVYYLYGQGWATVAQNALGIGVSVEQTDGPNHNLINIQDGDFMLGMTTMGPAYEAWHGLEDWTGGIEHTDVRSLFPMYNTYFHWIADR